MKQAFVLVCGVSPWVAVLLPLVLEEGVTAKIRLMTFMTVRVQLSSRGWRWWLWLLLGSRAKPWEAVAGDWVDEDGEVGWTEMWEGEEEEEARTMLVTLETKNKEELKGINLERYHKQAANWTSTERDLVNPRILTSAGGSIMNKLLVQQINMSQVIRCKLRNQWRIDSWEKAQHDLSRNEKIIARGYLA